MTLAEENKLFEARYRRFMDRVREAKAHLYAAKVQRAPSDDRIIAGHIDDAHTVLEAISKEAA